MSPPVIARMKIADKRDGCIPKEPKKLYSYIFRQALRTVRMQLTSNGRGVVLAGEEKTRVQGGY